MTINTNPRPRRLHVARGQRKPPNTVLVCRPYRYGNPFDWREYGRTQAVAMHSAWITNPTSEPIRLGKVTYRPATEERIRADLAGMNIACRCPDDGQPCHGDTLLEIANRSDCCMTTLPRQHDVPRPEGVLPTPDRHPAGDGCLWPHFPHCQHTPERRPPADTLKADR